MKNLAPDIIRQRLLLEGFYTIKIDKVIIEKYFTDLTNHLSLRTYAKPIIFSPEGTGKDGNQGYDAFIPLIDSGISLYVWSSSRFLSVVIFTCKSFDTNKAIEFTKEFFQINEMEQMTF